MKIYAISDLHLDDYPQNQNEAFAKNLPNADILVMAGDFTNGPEKIGRFYNFVELVKERYKHIIFTRGNHDHWHAKSEESFAAFKKLENEKIHFLDNETLELPDFPEYLFYGGTLWYVMSNPFWIDERKIKDREFIKKANLEFKEKLKAINTDKKLICISHHLPANASISPLYRGFDTNAYFVDSTCEALIKEKNPVMWIHGHTHEYTEVIFEKTQIIANPRGYNKEHDDQFVINSLNRIYTV